MCTFRDCVFDVAGSDIVFFPFNIYIQLYLLSKHWHTKTTLLIQTERNDTGEGSENETMAENRLFLNQLRMLILTYTKYIYIRNKW